MLHLFVHHVHVSHRRLHLDNERSVECSARVRMVSELLNATPTDVRCYSEKKVIEDIEFTLKTCTYSMTKLRCNN